MKKIFLTLSLLTAYNSSVLAAEQQNEHTIYKCTYPNCTYKAALKQDMIRHITLHTGELKLDDKDSDLNESVKVKSKNNESANNQQES